MTPTTSEASDNHHFSYYDSETSLSFVWNGESELIDVIDLTTDEVTDRFPTELAPSTVIRVTDGSRAWVAWFQTMCQFYLGEKKR